MRSAVFTLFILSLSLFLLSPSISAKKTERKNHHANLYRLNEQQIERERQLESNSLSLSPLSSLPEQWFNQTLDHFDPSNTATYRQRYYMNADYYVPGGPVFLYIGGEAELSSGSISSGEVVDNAKSHHGLLFAVEHRYYGASHPFDNLKTENLRFLSSQQALADLASFITAMNDQLQSTHALSSHPKWFTVGGSYPGCLSAWFRLKYPHLTTGSIASSAPVFAKKDFFEYDQIVSQAVGETCTSDIQAANKAVEQELFKSASSASALKSRFGCANLDDNVGFLYVLADAVAYSIQYTSDRPGSRYHLKQALCSYMADEKESDLTQRYVNFVSDLFGRLGVTCYDFTTTDTVLENTEVSPSMNQRQWYFQSCVEFGFFQTAPKTNSLRSQMINVTYHLNLCKKAFGVPLVPHTEWTNAYYGGRNPVGSNVYFVNGGIDPWHALSVIEPLPTQPDIQVRVINGTSHCADLYASSPNDPASLTEARVNIAHYVTEWIGNSPSMSTERLHMWIYVSATVLGAAFFYKMRKTQF